MNQYLKILLRLRWPGLLFLALATTLFFFGIIHLSVDNSTKTWFDETDSIFQQYVDFKEEFGNDHILLLGIEFRQKYDDPACEMIGRISRNIESMPDVESVSSIYSVKQMMQDVGISYPDLDNSFLSRDSLHTLLIINVSEKGSQVTRSEIIRGVNEIARINQKEFKKYRLSGSLYMGAMLDQHSKNDSRKILGLTFIGIVAVLLLLFQNLKMVLILLLSSSIPVVWSLGFIGLTGQSMNVVSNIIIPLILTCSLAFSVHIVNNIGEELDKGIPQNKAIICGVSKIWMPGFLSAVTTAAGLFSLYFSPVEAVSKFGLNAMAGILMQFICVIHLLPILLSFIDVSKSLKRNRADTLIGRILEWVVYRIQNRSVETILIFSIGTAVMLSGVLLIRINSNQLKYFRKKSDVVTSANYFDRNFGGTFPLQIVLSSGERAFLDYPLLKNVSGFQDSVSSAIHLERQISFADLITRANISPATRTVFPAKLNQMEIRQQDDSYSYILRKMINSDESRMVLSFLAKSSMSSSEMIKVQDRMLDAADDFFTGTGIQSTATGILPLYAHFHEYMVRTQLLSFGIAFIIVVLIIAFTFRSLRLLILVFFSNLSAIVLVFGIMGFFRINLDVGTVMLASIALGITIDDTIHLLFRTGAESTSSNLADAFKTSIGTIGKAVVYTSVILGTGFLMLIFIDFNPAKFFGLLTALVILFGLLADLLFLPALIIHFKTSIRKFNVNNN